MKILYFFFAPTDTSADQAAQLKYDNEEDAFWWSRDKFSRL